MRREYVSTIERERESEREYISTIEREGEKRDMYILRVTVKVGRE